MENKRGMSKITIVIIIAVIVVITGAAIFATLYFINKNKVPEQVVKLYDDFEEGAGFVDDESQGETLTPLANGLKEYRNDELGVRFGYLDSLDTPEDEELEDGTYSSVMKSNVNKSTIVTLTVGNIDVSQSDIDYIQKQKEALTQELIKAETKIVEVEENGKKIQKEVPPEKVSDIAVSYTLLSNQLAVKFTYTENDLMCSRVLTIKDGNVYALTYKANPNDYSYTEEDKVVNSFEFINKITDTTKTALNTVTINGKDYTLPVKISNIEGLTMNTRYMTQKISPNYFTIVSLYENQIAKYSAYVYNPFASMGEIGKGYVTAISTDTDRGGNIKIYKGIELGTSYSRVKELLGSPSKSYYSDDATTLTNIYQIEEATIQLKFRNDDLSKPGDSSKVVSILIKVAR